MDAAARMAFKPQLNSEHREARWWPLAGLPPPEELHPVVVYVTSAKRCRAIVMSLPCDVQRVIVFISHSKILQACMTCFGVHTTYLIPTLVELECC